MAVSDFLGPWYSEVIYTVSSGTLNPSIPIKGIRLMSS